MAPERTEVKDTKPVNEKAGDADKPADYKTINLLDLFSAAVAKVGTDKVPGKVEKPAKVLKDSGTGSEKLTLGFDVSFKSVLEVMAKAQKDHEQLVKKLQDTAAKQAVSIKKDFEPKEHVITSKDNLTNLAKEQIGKEATPGEIDEYIKEAARLNHLRDANILVDGRTLMLPGHTADGGVSVLDPHGNKITAWKDGRTREDRTNSTGFTRKDDGKGGSVEKHWGPTDEDNYTLEKLEGSGGKTTKQTDKFGNVLTTFENGTSSLARVNGSGFIRSKDESGQYREYHWGPTLESNYYLAPTAPGVMTGADLAGNTHAKLPNGMETMTMPDKRGYMRTGGDTAFNVQHFGPRPKDNFVVRVSPDGKDSYHESQTDKAYKPMDGDAVAAQRDKLMKNAHENIPTADMPKFKADMARFEDRMNKIEDDYRKTGLTNDQAHARAQKEVAGTYEQMSRLLEAPDRSPITKHQRAILAEQIINQAATPTSIDQGKHLTCNVTVVETRTYTKQPQEAAKLVVDVATTGQYTGKDGTLVKVDYESLKPHTEALKHLTDDGKRSFASQIFQVTAVNLHYAKNLPHIKYVQHEPENTDDTGERQIDNSSGSPVERKPSDFEQIWEDESPTKFRRPDLADSEIVDIGNRITGDTDRSWYVIYGKDGDGKVARASSKEELASKIRRAYDTGNLPLVIGVNTGNQPFRADGGSSGPSGGWHVVTITGYENDVPGGAVKIDNQWGTGDDHQTPKRVIAIDDLFHTMRAPNDKEAVTDLARDVYEKGTKGDFDAAKYAELLRRGKLAGIFNDEELAEFVKTSAKSAKTRGDQQKKAGTLDEDKYWQLKSDIEDLVHMLPAGKRMALLQYQNDIGLMSDSRFDYMIEYEFMSVYKKLQKDTDDGNYFTGSLQDFSTIANDLRNIVDKLPEKRRLAIEEELRKKLEKSK